MSNYEQMNNNRVYLSGKIISEPVFSHNIADEGFFEMFVSVSRLSDQKDILPITISERLIAIHNLKVGMSISFSGQFRSYNKFVDGKNKLMLTMFIRQIEKADENKNPNMIFLSGHVCKKPVYRTTPFSREICDILLAVNRPYNKSDYVPCICWGRNAKFAQSFNIGDKVAVTGRIQSREYQKKVSDDEVEFRVAYEVSVSKIVTGDACEGLANEVRAQEGLAVSYAYDASSGEDLSDIIDSAALTFVPDTNE